MSRRTACAVALGSVLASSVLAGCVSLPDEGPVVETEASGRGAQTDAMNINPRGPAPGQSPSEVVKGFLDAMQATPIRTTVARQFLTRQARDTWTPNETITYATAALPGGPNPVTVALSGADRLDARGAWQGSLPATRSTFTIRMVQENGAWRISDPPDALIVPESWFEQRFRQVSLYFFDASARVLVPDPVFVPRGKQLASALVNGLLAGPADAIVEHALNAVPPNLRAAVSVPVSPVGVAEVELSSATGDAAMPTDQEAELMVAQLAWTLRQDPSVERLSISIDGQPVELAGGVTEFSVQEGDEFAPYVASASTVLYGLADGLLVAGSAQNLDPVSGPFGTTQYGLRTISPDLLADQAAGVTAGGTAMLLGPVRDDPREVHAVITGATDLLEPAWDFAGRLWFVDRRADGARLGYVQDDTPQVLDVPGISGEDVRHLLVSRDGSRLVAVVRRRGDDAILVSRLLSNGRGRVEQALPAIQVTEEDGRGLRIRDVAWRSPTSIAVLQVLSKELFQVRATTVDGAPTGLDSLSVTLDGRITGLAGTPKPDEHVYALTPGGLIDLSGSAGGTTEIDPDVSSLDYVG
jgi:hypothetical protein